MLDITGHFLETPLLNLTPHIIERYSQPYSCVTSLFENEQTIQVKVRVVVVHPPPTPTVRLFCSFQLSICYKICMLDISYWPLLIAANWLAGWAEVKCLH